MTRPFADYDGFELWFLTGSQGLYGEETLRRVAAQSQQVVETLDAASVSSMTPCSYSRTAVPSTAPSDTRTTSARPERVPKSTPTVYASARSDM